MGGSDSPDVPSAGENYKDALEAQLRFQGSRRELDFLDQLGNIDMLRRLAPALANVQLGFEEQFGPQIRAAESEAIKQARLGDIQNVTDIAPLFNQAVEASDPRQAAIRKLLGEQVHGELQAGAGLDDGLRREIQQGVRAGQGARGISFGNAPVSEEAFAQGRAGLDLRRSRQQAAENFLRTSAATQPSALNFMTNRSGGSLVNAPGLPNAGTQGRIDQTFGAATQANNLQSQLDYNSAQQGGFNVGGAVGGGLGGAAMGAQIGAAGGPIGMGLGALIGAVGGGLM
jgi:hypothetical protein